MPDTQTRKRRWFRRRTVVIGSALGVALTLGVASTWALEHYVIAHVAISDVDAYEAEQSALAEATASGTGAVTSDPSYSSDDAGIPISKVTTGTGDAAVT